MKTKTLGLIAVMASLLVTGCNKDNDSSKNNSGNINHNEEAAKFCPDGYTVVNSAKTVPARGIPSNLQDVSGVKEYRSAFSSDPNTFDYLSNNKQTNSEYYSNFVDNLLEHDQYGQIRGALAIGAYYNSDYTKLQFRLREGVKWVLSTGVDSGYEVVADDFKAGLQHLLDAKGGAETLAYYIVGAKEYADGKDTNFDNVGLEVIDDYTIEYELNAPCPFFHTFFEYTSFLPMNREFFESLGGAFGKDWKKASETCDFGKTSRTDTLLYCGPYILSNFTSNQKLSMTRNPLYWDIGNVKIETVDFSYDSGDNVASLFEKFEKGQLTSLGINSQNYEMVSEKYADSIYEQGTGTTTYYFNWNLNRKKYEVGDCVTGKTTDAEKNNTRTAILNENFRKAVFSAIPKIEMNSLADDANTAAVCVRNTYTTPEFVNIKNDATTTTGVEHSAGSYYYQMVNNEMKNINEVEGHAYAQYASSWEVSGATGTEVSSNEESTFNDRENSYFNVTTARFFKNKATQELGNTVTYPIHIDYLTFSASDVFLAQAQLLKAKVEEILGADFITINIQKTANQNNYQNSHFMAASGSEMNFDLSSGTGWGPDYGDPATFLNTLTWEGNLLSNLGFDANAADETKYNQVLGDYRELFEEASAITDRDEESKRYAMLAAAEAELLNTAVIMPNTTDGGGYAVSRIVPRSNQRTFYGTDDSRYKYMVIVNKVLTTDERKAIIADWEAEFNANFSEENN